uniref:RNA helicase n=1 Tax=Anopheles christyi TaxID=43041 RepID=A0A182JT94_9DIPT
MSEENNVIRITRYINPHNFYYKPLIAFLPDHEQTQFAVALNQYCETTYGELYRTVRKPQAWEIKKPGTLVALRSVQLERWIRCVVEETFMDLNEDIWYQLWAIDEGIAVKSDPKYVRPLPEVFAKEPAHAKRGALINVVPSDTRFDYVQNEQLQEPSSQWCPGIVTILEQCLEEAVSVTMVDKAKLILQSETIHFGELYVTSQNNTSGNVTNLLRAACPKQIIVTPAAGFIKAFVKLQKRDRKRFYNNEGLFDKHIVNNVLQTFSRNNLPHNHHQERAMGMNTELSQKVQEWLRRNQEECLAVLQEHKTNELQPKVPEIINIAAESVMRYQQKDHELSTTVQLNTSKAQDGIEAPADPSAERLDYTVKHAALCSKPSSILLNVKRHKARLLLKNATSAE